MQNPRLKRKILSVILAVCYIISSFTTQFAATPQLNVVIGSAQGTPGSIINIPINFINVPDIGINNCDFTFKYDSNILEFVSTDAGDIVTLPQANLSSNNTEDTIKFLFNDATQKDMPIKSDGLFANVKFKIKSNAPNGTSNFTITNYGSFSGMTNSGMSPINPIFTSGSIIVSDILENALKVNIGKVQGVAGSEVSVPVTFSDIPDIGINNCNFSLSYDTNALEFVSTEAGSIVPLPIADYVSNSSSDGIIKFLYNDSSQGDRPIKTSGVFASIKFRVKNSVSEGEYKVELSKVGSFSGKIANGLKSIDTEFSSGSVSVVDIINSATPTNIPVNTPTNSTNKYSITVEIGEASGQAGNIVSIPVLFKGVPTIGVNNCNFTLSYDANALEFDSADAGEKVPLAVANFSSNVLSDGKIKFLFNDSTQGQMPIKEDGIFTNIKFKIKPDASAGKFDIKIDTVGSFSGLLNSQMNSINPTFVNGSVTVGDTSSTPVYTPTSISTPKPTSNKPKINVEIGKQKGIAGSTIIIPVFIKNIPSMGINNCNFTLKYNTNVLEFVSAEAGEKVPLALANFSSNNPSEDKVKFLFNDSTQGQMPFKEDGIFTNLKFNIKSNATPGTYDIQLDSLGSFSGIESGSMTSIDADFITGTVEVTNTVDTELPSNTSTSTSTPQITLEPTPSNTPMYNMNVKIGKVSGVIGDVVNVPIEFNGVPAFGINNCDFNLSYDKNNFELVSTDAGSIIKDSLIDFASMQSDGVVSLLFNDQTQQKSPIINNGVFANIKLRIKSNAVYGIYPIKVDSVGKFSGDLNGTLTSINPIFEEGSINVGSVTPTTNNPSATPANKVDVIIGKVSGIAGSEVVVPVEFKNMPSFGINNCNFVLSYDSSALEFKSADAGDIVTIPVAN
ncbi:MAG: cohesin domain-containing protein, partial [Bacillota bacterium]|nr:cohesin domain-containing protein [Bacillota bacterium]